MKGLKNLLVKEQEKLQRIIRISKTRLENVPEGKLRISKSHGYIQYYQCTEDNNAGRYICKENAELVRKLAQKTYDEKVLRVAEKRLVQINKLLKTYDQDEITNMYYNENPLRQNLIIPVEPTWEQKLNEWISKKWVGKGFGDGLPVILSERGERVRSKSEKILADYFYRNGIAYKYECPIYLNGLGIVYPDFTFLSKKTGEEIYWEHNGMVDSPDYARKMVRKINAYEQNGFFAGERLILTYETEQTIINTEKIEQMVKRYL